LTWKIGRIRKSVVDAILGVDLRGHLFGLQESLYRNELKQIQRDEEMEIIFRRLAAQLEVIRMQRDDIRSLKRALEEIRRTGAYAEAFEEKEPLITVRIASYQKTDELIEVAVSSVLAQSYGRFELIIVNDGPNDRTRKAVASLGDSRIQYVEFPHRSNYPDDPHSRWMVAGSPGMNRGTSLATGTWIAPLDEDDLFTPDHLEKLLLLAQSKRVELAYGALIQKNMITGDELRIWSSPPRVSNFSFQGAIYLRQLVPTFHYDESSWVVEEPGDWNLIRRMTAAGVTMAAIEDVVATMNHTPYTHRVQL